MLFAGLGYAEQPELDVTLDHAEQTLFGVTQRQRGADFVPLSTVVQQYFERSQRDEDERVVPTRLLDLDRRLDGGLRPGQLALLAARPGLGKSGLAILARVVMVSLLNGGRRNKRRTL